jgi:16S rRNA (adenine1518-N6/adenine1519-N6)-dimethyltransferase
MSRIRQILNSGFKFKHKLGQNFIYDTNLLNSIAAQSDIDGAVVLEIGAGPGTLTQALAARADKVIAYEIDSELINPLEENLSGLTNVTIIYKDFMKVSEREISDLTGGAFGVVANLPYYITTPVIMKFIESALPVKSMTLMVQKEVADRLIALPGTPEYGAITLSVDISANVKSVKNIRRNLFYPVPNVDSTLIKIDIDREKYDIKYYAILKKLIKSAFSMRRKTLVNNITKDFNITKERAAELINGAGIDIRARGETLNTPEFIRLSEALGRILC